MPTPTKGPRLGGGPAHERLLLAGLATALFEHDRITTTEAKAKRLRPLAERLVTFAKRGDLHARRRVLTVVRDKGAVHRLFTEIAPDMAQRPGGYTRITKIGPRKGDNAPMAVIELVREPLSARQSTVAEAQAATRRAAAQQPAGPATPPPDAGGATAGGQSAGAPEGAAASSSAAAAAGNSPGAGGADSAETRSVGVDTAGNQSASTEGGSVEDDSAPGAESGAGSGGGHLLAAGDGETDDPIVVRDGPSDEPDRSQQERDTP